MKIKILTAMFLFSVLVSGCESPQAIQAPSQPTNSGYKIRTIDNCQYIEVDQGIFDQRIYSLTHKGDCNSPIHCYNKVSK